MELHYLQAFCLFNIGEIQEAKEILDDLEKLNITESKDNELKEGFLELKAIVKQKLSNNGKTQN